jgi:hypothetical protein
MLNSINNRDYTNADITPLILTDYMMAFNIDPETLDVYTFDYNGLTAEYESEGILREICPDIGSKIEGHFKINLKDYGVEIIDEVIEMDIS